MMLDPVIFAALSTECFSRGPTPHPFRFLWVEPVATSPCSRHAVGSVHQQTSV